MAGNDPRGSYPENHPRPWPGVPKGARVGAFLLEDVVRIGGKKFTPDMELIEFADVVIRNSRYIDKNITRTHCYDLRTNLFYPKEDSGVVALVDLDLNLEFGLEPYREPSPIPD